MFWQRTRDGKFYYLAVLEMVEITDPKDNLGRKTYQLKLSDGPDEVHTFETQEWDAWQKSLRKGGVVLNAE